MRRFPNLRALLACGLALAFVPVWAQETSDTASPLEGAEDGLAYQELQLREQADAERRLEIVRMRGEASRLIANTEELNAQAQNCAARRAAYEAGAPVDLCENDRPVAPFEETGIAGASGTAPSAWLTRLEERMAELESRLHAAPEGDLKLPASKPLTGLRQFDSGAVLLLSGPARAVVRLPDNKGDALYRLPFEARREGDDCIETVSARAGVPAGTRICKEGVEP